MTSEGINSGRNCGKRPRLVKQPHGGALLDGGIPGNGGGRPPSAVRAAMRVALEARLPILTAIADDEEARPSDRVRALELLARYGLGQAHEVSGPDGGRLALETVDVAGAREELARRIEKMQEARRC